MATFDDSAAYKAKGDGQFHPSIPKFLTQKPQFDDGRETALLHHLYSHPSLPTLRSNPPAILAAIDAYARTHNYLMNIGSSKGAIVTSTIASLRSKHLTGKPYLTMVELGAYVGYSTVLFGAALRDLGKELGVKETRYFSLERDPVFAAVTASIVDLAGLSDTVKVLVGPSDEGIQRLFDAGRLDPKERQIDVLFLDHYKPAYTTDLKLCEELGLIKVPVHAPAEPSSTSSAPSTTRDHSPWKGTGTVLCADNVVSPGNPPYLEYVRSSPSSKRSNAASALHASQQRSSGDANGDGDSKGNGDGVDARFTGKIKDMYAHRVGEAKLDSMRVGDPGIVYESRLVESFEPTGEADGVEITWCVGREEGE
ncbi:MAG: hypothetical protein M1828_004079 [Chrysothrix sp. TS-e1954]|nr:MAG: hypothetical protein M1828_004079 [Chrysothrix sp. TS-e1954]